MARRYRAIARTGMILSLSAGLTGCIAAAAPLMMAASVGVAALSGFEVYKTVQLSGGGAVHIEFPGKDGKTNPPEPLPVVHHVAVWPGDEGDVRFAEKLQESGKFSTVTPPAAVSRVLVEDKTPSDLKQLTAQEQDHAFGLVCRRTRADLVFASRPLGATTNENVFSFSHANVTYKADLLGYSCQKRDVIWRDQIALVLDVGNSTPDTAEMNQAGADAWADRVFRSMSQSVAHE